MALAMHTRSLVLLALLPATAAYSPSALAFRPRLTASAAAGAAARRMPRADSSHMADAAAPRTMKGIGKLNPVKGIVDIFQGSSNFEPVACGDLDECIALCDEEECHVLAPTSLLHRLKVGFYFGVWFLLSVGYSVTNKKVTNVLPLPWTVATASVLVGSVFVSGMWATGARTPPTLPRGALLALLPVGAFHAIGHIAGTLGTAAGSVSFAQVVKAAGPVYACILSALFLSQRVSRRVALSLVPIMSGVALATLKELEFSWLALGGAVVSDLALALRNVCSKLSMDAPKGKNMTPANLFGVLTVISTLVSLPMAFIAERHVARAAWAAATATMPAQQLLWQITLTGLYFYGYSEVAMQALNNVSPVTHAIGNTLRRVVIMVVCAVVFSTPMTPLGMAGSGLAIGGSYLYTMAKHAEKAAEKAAEAEKAAVLTEPVIPTPPSYDPLSTKFNSTDIGAAPRAPAAADSD